MAGKRQKRKARKQGLLKAKEARNSGSVKVKGYSVADYTRKRPKK